jgi:hypothetical protein
MKIRLFLLAAIAFVASLAAQAPNAPGQSGKNGIPAAPDAAIVVATIEDAKTAARLGNVVQAEQAVNTLNRAKPGTAAYFMASAQRLLELAEQISLEGRTDKVAPLASRALQNLAQAETYAKTAAVQAQAKTLAGMIYERYFGDTDSALASYKAASQLSPGTADRAQEAAERLKRSDDNVKARLAAGGK